MVDGALGAPGAYKSPGLQLGRRGGREAGDQDPAVRGQQALDDPSQVGAGLALGIDGLGQAEAQLAVKVQVGEAEVRER